MSELTKEQEQQRYLLKRAVQYMDGDTDSGEHHDALNALYASLAAKERELQDAEREIDVRFEHWSPPEVVEGLEQQLQEAQAPIEEAQRVMQQFAHIYPDGFPGDWKVQPEHLVSQVTFLCNRQRTEFQQRLDMIERNKQLERDLETARGINAGLVQALMEYGQHEDAVNMPGPELARTAVETAELKALATLNVEKSGG